MIRANHLIFTAYGFWLPNDPRGSWSNYVRAYELYQAGPATKLQPAAPSQAGPITEAIERAPSVN